MPETIEFRPVASLAPSVANARTHSKKNVAKLAASIREYGWTQPILITDAGDVVAGHGRLLAAMQLGIDIVPCIRLANLTDAQVRAYRIADNQLGLDSDWDYNALARELGDLQAIFDLSNIGFDAKDLQKLLAKDEQNQFQPEIREDDIPNNIETSSGGQEIIVSKYGQIWELGNHRLACGDCTDPTVVNPLLAGVSINLMVTDPPYGVNYDAEWRNEVLGRNAPRDMMKNDHHADWRGAFAYFRGNIAYVWHGGLQSGTIYDMINASGFDVKAQIIWAKPGIVINRGAYNWQHEPCYYAVRRGQTADWQGPANASTLWEVQSPNQKGGKDENDMLQGHATQKPVEVMRRPIFYHTSKNEAVYDPFLGSGTTIIAAETAGRICYGIELLPKYADIIIKRWQLFTGREAICNGKTYLQYVESKGGNTNQARSCPRTNVVA